MAELKPLKCDVKMLSVSYTRILTSLAQIITVGLSLLAYVLPIFVALIVGMIGYINIVAPFVPATPTPNPTPIGFLEFFLAFIVGLIVGYYLLMISLTLVTAFWHNIGVSRRIDLLNKFFEDRLKHVYNFEPYTPMFSEKAHGLEWVTEQLNEYCVKVPIFVGSVFISFIFCTIPCILALYGIQSVCGMGVFVYILSYNHPADDISIFMLSLLICFGAVAAGFLVAIIVHPVVRCINLNFGVDVYCENLLNH